MVKNSQQQEEEEEADEEERRRRRRGRRRGRRREEETKEGEEEKGRRIESGRKFDRSQRRRVGDEEGRKEGRKTRSSGSIAMQLHLPCLVAACSIFFFLFFPVFASSSLSFPLDTPSAGFACEIARCLRGTCLNTSSFPFYKCDCDDGWKSPFGSSWLPCIVPNCTFDFTCANTTKSQQSPPSLVFPPFGGAFDICSLGVCGNGECIHDTSGNGSTFDDPYVCKCDDGFFNFRNKSDGYCLHKCSVGADCTNLRLPLGGASPPPSNTQPSSLDSNQGTPPTSQIQNESSTSEGHGNKHLLPRGLVILATMALVALYS